MITPAGTPLSPPPVVRQPEAIAGVLTAPRRFSLQAVDPPVPGPGAVRIRTRGCGVCASGLPVWQGRDWFAYPFKPGQLGHEGWGVIDCAGPGVEPSRVGEHVVTWADGAFARYFCVDQAEVLTVPSRLADRPLPVEPLGCAVNIVRRARVERGMPVVIVGIGFLGALLVQLLQAAGCEVHAVARREFSQNLARRLGVCSVSQFASPPEVVEQFRSRGIGAFPRVIEAVGLPESLDVASALVATGGVLVVAGYHQEGLRPVNFQEWNWKGIDVINAHERDPEVVRRGMREAIDALQQGHLDPGPLLSHRYAPGQLNQAFADLESRPDGFLKGWIDFTLNP